MATSVFFNQQTAAESRFVEDIIIEQIKAFGHDVVYLPRELVKEDQLFGEDILSSFSDSYVIEMYFENESFDMSEGEALSKFGLEIRDEAKFQVSASRWEDLISSNRNLISNTRPNEGDLIFFKQLNKLYEITFCEDENFQRLGLAGTQVPAYTLTCKVFEYSSETLDTGIEDIDIIETRHSVDLMLIDTLELEDSIDELLLEDGFQLSFETDSTIDRRIETVEPLSINTWLETKSDDVLDFTNKNPFGD
jgi:hypothetical protein